MIYGIPGGYCRYVPQAGQPSTCAIVLAYRHRTHVLGRTSVRVLTKIRELAFDAFTRYLLAEHPDILCHHLSAFLVWNETLHCFDILDNFDHFLYF